MTPLLARPRVLVFAYACEPGRGSEPGAGWGLVNAVSEFADCVVLVGPAHVAAIAEWERSQADRRLKFVVVPEAAWPSPANRSRISWFVAYLRWLGRAASAGRRLHTEQPFDAVFHATYSTYYLPTSAALLGLPFVWGPVGGAVTTPLRLWPLLGLRGIVGELLDLVAVRVLAALPATRKTWRRAGWRIVQNEATLARLPSRMRSQASVLNHALFTEVGPAIGRTRGGFLLSVAALEARKGVALVIAALARTPADVRLLVIGDGPARPTLERLARTLGVSERVDFRGSVPRAQAMELMARTAAVVFAGLREEGGLALAEAMLLGVPVIVLAHGGARTIAECTTDPSRVMLIEPGGIDATTQRLAQAMTRLSTASAWTAGSTLDQPAARGRLRDAFTLALAQPRSHHLIVPSTVEPPR